MFKRKIIVKLIAFSLVIVFIISGISLLTNGTSALNDKNLLNNNLNNKTIQPQFFDKSATDSNKITGKNSHSSNFNNCHIPQVQNFEFNTEFGSANNTCTATHNINYNVSKTNNQIVSSSYGAEFIQSGYPIGSGWGIQIINCSLPPSYFGNYSAGSSNSCFISLPQGTYKYVIMAGNSVYSVNNGTGKFSIMDSNITIHINFYKSPITVYHHLYSSISVNSNLSFNISQYIATYSFGNFSVNFGVMNSTFNISVMNGNQLIYDKNIAGQPASYTVIGPSNTYGYENFNYVGNNITLTVKNIGNLPGLFAFNVWNGPISNYTASLITLPPQFSENFGFNTPTNFPNIDNNTGLSFTLQAPFYNESMPLSIWIGEGFDNPVTGQNWWAQIGFNDWLNSLFYVSFAGWGIFSNTFGSPGGTDGEFPLIPGNCYNFTMELIQNDTWGFFVNGVPIVEQQLSGFINTTSNYSNEGQTLGFEVQTQTRAGNLSSTAMLPDPVKIIKAMAAKVNDKWVNFPNFYFNNVGENWLNGNTTASMGMNLWGVSGNIQNRSIQNGSIIFKNSNMPLFTIPTCENITTAYPVYGNFTYPCKNITKEDYISVQLLKNDTIYVVPKYRGTLLSLIEFKNFTNILENFTNYLIYGPTYLKNPYIGKGEAITAALANNTLFGYGGDIQEIVVTQLKKYNVEFTEAGLPAGTLWFVNTSNGKSYKSTNTTITFQEPNGTYLYSISTVNKVYEPTQKSCSFAVTGSSISKSITFSEILYSVTFTETGLPPSISWYVNITESNGTEYLSGQLTGFTYSINLPNGTYQFVLSTADKDYAPSYNDSFTVRGSSISIPVVFKPVTYEVTFNSINLPPGDIWYVNITGLTGSGPITSNSFTIYLQNASYSFSVESANKTYAPSYVSTFSVSGSPLTININFTEIRYNLTIQESGLSSNTEWNLTFAGTTYHLTNSSYVFSEPNGTYSFFATSHDYKDVSGTITVKGSSLTYTIKMQLQLYEITFSETGLPSGMFWYVNISGMASSGPIASGSFYTVNLTNGTYIYSTSTSNRTYAPVSTMNSLTVNGSSLDIVTKIIEVTYSVEFSESGLPSGMTWYVNLSNSMDSGPIAGSSYAFSLPNGTYTYTIASSNRIYTPSQVSGTVDVIGLAVSEKITFAEVTYSVSFSETGLPSGINWYVNITESNGTAYLSGPISGSTYSFSLTNGSYSYTIATSDKIYEPSIISSPLTVNGSPISESIIFSEVLYSVSFTETGLPSGISWYVNISGMASSGPISGSSYTFSLINGSYTYTIISANRIYAPNPISGKFTVDGSVVQLSIAFTAVKYAVTFSETGLPSGINWYVNITESNGTAYLSGPISGSTYSFSLTNGSYTYTIASANRIYAPNPISNTLTVNGAALAEPITFSEVLYSVSFTETGLPSGINWYVNITESNGSTYFSGPISGSTYSFSLTNGSYKYMIATPDKIYEPSTISSTFTVKGFSVPISITFSAVKYTITFTETGLPSGITWYVNLSNGLSSGPISIFSYTFSLINGSYTYTIASANKIYEPSPISASFTVDGSSLAIQTTFTELRYNVTIQESGLSANTEWNLTFQGITYHLTNSSYVFSEPNGTYSYLISPEPGYTVSSGFFTVSGKSLTINIVFTKNATVYVKVSPSSASFYVNGKEYILSSGSIKLSLSPGSYFVNASKSGYYSYTNLFTFGSSVYYVNITLVKLVTYGYLAGSVSPDTAIISANGILIDVSNGLFNQTLSPGEYIVSVSASGYTSRTYDVNITANSVTALSINLTKAVVTYTITGYINPHNASIMFGEYSAYVNSTGYYIISLPSGSYMISVTATGYYSISENLTLTSNVEMNFSLVALPPVTSNQVVSNTTAQGYNVTVSNLSVGDGNISVTYNSTPNGTIVVILPYSEVKNATVSELLNSTVYVNGVKYTNFTIALSTINGTFDAILTVYGLSGDPVLIWAYSPSFKLPVHTVAPVTSNNYMLYAVIGIAAAAVIAVGVILIRRRK